jgi:ABC-type transporter Mla subunit MlaD
LIPADKGSENNIDQIRKLIFGEQMSEYDRKYIELQKQVEKLEAKVDESLNEIRDLISASNSTQQASIEKLDQSINQTSKKLKSYIGETEKNLQEKIDRLNDEKTNRSQLANHLIELAMSLKGENILEQLSEEAEAARNG